ncbi:FprA family A-type flavoprotein [candidate division KSB1 bacterium]|nr:FprA family A-type flavoprotein [candidate division KSB1 bacterium]
MLPIKLKSHIYWVGGIDWGLRNFHGYLTQRGSTYNAYLILDEKIALLDTVKYYLFDEMLERVSHVIDPAKIDYIISNHVEMDHSGGIVKLKEIAPKAAIITSPNGEKGLKAHYNKNWEFKVVKTGDTLKIGKRTLHFALTPMVHWPDNMVTYLPGDNILFSNDAFGQHLASSERFDDQYPINIIIEEAKKYYANIVLPYSKQVQKALADVSNFNIEMIAPSHGIIWREHLADIIGHYQKWSANQTDDKALIIYDTMWGSTEKIAVAIGRAFESEDIKITMLNLRHNHISDIMTEILTAKYVCVGSPTLNSNMLPTVAAFLTYLKGLAPQDRIGLAFGSYGWANRSVVQIDEILRGCGFNMLEKISVNYIPTETGLQEITSRIKGVIR